jgi:hypothetical protein
VKNPVVVCTGLALIAAVIYFLTGSEVISIPETDLSGGPPGWAYVAGGCYLVGGLLILLRKRWLWIIGLAANTLVIIVFFTMHHARPEILTSLPGLGTKIPQILLEIGLIYLIATFRKNTA